MRSSNDNSLVFEDVSLVSQEERYDNINAGAIMALARLVDERSP